MESRRAAEADKGNARGDRARTAICDALLALVEEGHLRPTTAEIAERAGVAERTLYFHFRDTETLFCEVAERRFELLLPLLEPIDVQLAFDERLRRFVKQRVQLLELITAGRRAANLKEPDSPAIHKNLAFIRSLKAQQARAVMRPELDLCDGATRERTAAAVAAAASWSTWESLRAHQHLSVRRASEVLHLTLQRLLAPASPRRRRMGR